MQMNLAHHRNRTAYRAAVAVALLGVALLAWLAAGVGIIGADGDRANVLYGGVLAVGVVGSALARLHARGMAWTLAAMAVAQALVATVALLVGLGQPYSPPLELVALNGFFVTLFVGSALLFREAGRQ